MIVMTSLLFEQHLESRPSSSAVQPSTYETDDSMTLHGMMSKNATTISGSPPAPEPAARRGMRRLCLLLNNRPSALAVERPISTEGPSGPREHPVPRVMAAAVARRTGAVAARNCRLNATVPSAAIIITTRVQGIRSSSPHQANKG